LYKKLVTNVSDNYEILANMARCYETINKKNDMVSFLNELLSKNSQNVSAGIILSNIWMLDKQFDKSALLLTNLISGNKKIPELYVSLAKVKSAQGDNKAAIAVYKDGLKENVGDVKLLFPLAALYEIQADYDAAVSTYEALLATDPNLDLAINNLASILTEHYSSDDKLKKAIQLSEKFKDSKQPYYKDTYAWAIIKQGDVGRGLNLLSQIITAAPDVPIFRYHLGFAHYKNGNNGMAIAEIKQAIELAAKNKGLLDEKAATTLLNEIVAKSKRT
jgi:tetratricopeptide (TPR) repeat protein